MTQKKSIYLAGAIEKAPDLGATWRSEVSPVLESLGFKVLNPLKEESTIAKVEQIKKDYKSWDDYRRATTIEDYTSTLRQIVNLDLHIIDHETDILLVYWDIYVQQGAGTIGEITVAKYLGIPVYIVCSPCVKSSEIPGWILGCASQVFVSFDDGIEFLQENESDTCPRVGEFTDVGQPTLFF